MFVISFNICLFIYFSVKYAIQFFFVFLHFIFTKMELLTHEAKIKGKHLASLKLFLQSSIKIPLSSKKCLQLLYNSWTLINNLTAKLSSWCSSRPQACTSCGTISVVEVLVDLVVVLQVLEPLERLFGFSTMKRCFYLLRICLAKQRTILPKAQTQLIISSWLFINHFEDHFDT